MRLHRFSSLFVVLVISGCELDPFCLECGQSSADGSVASNDGSTENMDGSSNPLTDGAAQDQAQMCISADASEECNGNDDNCNGVVDEGFDLMNDPRNCGTCGHMCLILNAETECEMGECKVVRCQEGFKDIDSGVAGCEYQCPVFPTANEECNGLDDDCDGVVDNSDELPPAPASLCRRTPNTPCEGVTPVCETREGRTTWYCDYSASVEFDPRVPNGIALDEARCDSLDGDCDGVVDDSFATLGNPCDNGLRGACRDDGQVICNPADDSTTICDLNFGTSPVPGAPSAEVCNDIDDNCDGIVDNSSPGDAARIVDPMVHIVRGGLNFWIYLNEASRPDATNTSAGVLTTRACSVTNRMPWTTVGFASATAACAASGKRLCTAAEWQAACEGATLTKYPYGDAYATNTCNGADRDAIAGGTVDHKVEATGSLAMCVTPEGVFDLSGNVKEWTNDPRGTTGSPAKTIYVVRGGSNESPELGLTCQTQLSQASEDSTLPSLGFRCCSSTAP